MSGDHCNRKETQQPSTDDGEHQFQACSYSSSKSGGDSQGGSGYAKNVSPVVHDVPEKYDKKTLKLSRNELLESAEFNKTIATWFGEKGFIAMRSFFRASVLNSLQKDPIGLNEANCTDMDAVIVTLIADYLVKNAKYFTMSVFSNEVLRPLVNSNPHLRQVLQRIGKCDDLGEPALTPESVSYVLRTLDVPSHSVLGAGILHNYLEERGGDLLSVLMRLLRDNSRVLNVKEPAVRDDDVVAAVSEGLHEEMGKLHSWFSNFNSQFVDVSGKLRQLLCSTTENGKKLKSSVSGPDEQELWNQMLRMDEHLKKQQDLLMKMRDKERKKLSTYAKELEDLHQEMNLKLKSIQDYEKTLKIREKALKESEAIAFMEHRGRGDEEIADIRAKRGGRESSNQWFDPVCHQDARKIVPSMTGQVMEENLELRAIVREQNLRIEALTKRAAMLSAGCSSTMTSSMPNVSRNPLPPPRPSYVDIVTSREPYHREVLPKPQPILPFQSYSHGRTLESAMSSALRRTRMEIDCLRDEQNSTDLQYDRLLHNKLSKRL